MLKNLVFIVLSLLTCFGFQDDKIISFEYEASTRGVSKKVIIRKDSTFVFDQEIKIHVITKKDDWIFLNQRISQLDLKKIQLLEAPNEERYSDKALSAHIKIVTTNRSYESIDFDHGNSPKEIAQIVEVLTRYLPSE